MNIDPKKVFLCSPTHDGSFCLGYLSGVMQCHDLIGGAGFVSGMSHVALARNLQAAIFLQSPFEWLLSIDADIQFCRDDLQLLYEGDELLRVAEYSKKDFVTMEPNSFGMGFVLVHREVFAKIADVELESNPGVPVVEQFPWQGRLVHDYFISGVIHGGKWIGEDHGFFMLAKMAGVSTRVETRTRLVHWGRHGFTYTPPSVAPGPLPVQN